MQNPDISFHSKEKISNVLKSLFSDISNEVEKVEKTAVNTRGKNAQKSIVQDNDSYSSDSSFPDKTVKSFSLQTSEHNTSSKSKKTVTSDSSGTEKDTSKKSSIFKRLRNRLVKF